MQMHCFLCVVLLLLLKVITSVTQELRLVNSTSTSAQAGRLEIFLRGEWGTVCDDGFDRIDADVACRQLGFPPSTRVGNTERFGYAVESSSTPIWLDDVMCSTSAMTLLSCSHSGVGNHNCAHFEDVVLACGPTDCFANEFRCQNGSCVASQMCNTRNVCPGEEFEQFCKDVQRRYQQETSDSAKASLGLSLGLAFGLATGVAVVSCLVLLACMLFPCPLRKLYSSKPVSPVESDVGEPEPSPRGNINAYQPLSGTQT